MKATLEGHVIAKSNDIVDDVGYAYFPSSAVQTRLLEKSEKGCPVSNSLTAVKHLEAEIVEAA